MRFPFFILLLLTLLARAAERAPNIIHIVADDVGYDDLACFGAKDIATPHLDRLAAEGRRFTSFYAPHSTCTPSRAAMLTGCYASRVGLPTVLFPNSNTGIAEGETTIAELLKTRGYATALIGKWHLGHQKKFLPPNHGFDLFFGIPYPNDHGPERKAANGADKGFPPIPLVRGTETIESPAKLGECPERFLAEALKFMEENKERPFFLHFGNIETHTPWFISEKWQGKSKAGSFGDAVEFLDHTVGEIMAALKRLGLDEKTLVVFSADNGPLVRDYAELEGIYGKFAAVDIARAKRHLLREGKYQSRYEGGTRVACIARWPGRVPGGTTCDEVAAGFDLYPTFARLAGAELPQDRKLDGADITPLLFGEPGAKSTHAAFFYYQGFALAAVRDSRWKLVFTGAAQQIELYDLANDPAESKDVSAGHPEVIEHLNKLADAMRADLGDQSRGMPGSGRRPPGKY